MTAFVVFLYMALTLLPSVQTRGTTPLRGTTCRPSSKRARIDIYIETGSQLFSGTDDPIRLLLRDSEGVLCTANDLNNYGDDHKRKATDQFAICCPAEFAAGNGSLSLLLLGHRRNSNGHSNSWFVERVKVLKGMMSLLDYRFHAWTNPSWIHFFGVSQQTNSLSHDGQPTYSLIRF